MTRDEIMTEFRTLLDKANPKEIDWSKITEDSEIVSLGFDSLSILDLIYDVRDVFGVTLEPEELLNIKTIGDFISFLEKRLN